MRGRDCSHTTVCVSRNLGNTYEVMLHDLSVSCALPAYTNLNIVKSSQKYVSTPQTFKSKSRLHRRWFERERERESEREREREPKNMFNKSNACGLGGGGGGVVAKICIWSLRQPPPTTRRNRALCSKAPCVSRVLIKDLISRNRRPSSGGSFSRCSIPEGTESSRLSHAAATMLGVRGRRSIAVIATLLHSWASAAKLTC